MPQPVCYTVEHADSSKLYLGGVVGYNAGTIQGATYKAGMIINRRSNNNTPNLTAVGGIAGYNKGTIINEKYNVGDDSKGSVAGLIGSFKFVNMNVEAKVTGKFADYIGGIVGFSSGSISAYSGGVDIYTTYVATNSVVDYTYNADESTNGNGYKVLSIKLVTTNVNSLTGNNALSVTLEGTSGVPADSGSYITADDYQTVVASSWWGLSKKEAHFYAGRYRQVEVTRTNGEYGSFSVN